MGPIVMLAAQFVFRYVNECKYLICHVTGSCCNQIQFCNCSYTLHQCLSHDKKEHTILWSKIKGKISLFYILLAVHHVMILGKWPTWLTNSFLCICFLFI